jgi:hypothetical protein
MNIKDLDTNIQKKILGNKGRGEDTQIRKVDGKDSHVTSQEAYLLDKYGKDAESFVKTVGSGTINPETNLKEYDPSEGFSFHPAHHWTWESNPVADTLTDIGEDFDFMVNNLFDPLGNAFGGDVWDEMDTWTISSIFGEDQDVEDQAETIVEEGFGGLAGDVEAYLGEGGYLDREKDIAYSKADQEKMGYSLSGRRQMRDIKAGEAQAASRANLATSASVTNRTADAEADVEGAYNLNVAGTMTDIKAADLAMEKGRTDYLRGIRKEMNDLILKYTEITDDVYEGGDDMDALLALLDDDDITGG